MVLVHVAINTAVKNYNESELITNQILKQIKILKKNYDLQIQNMCKKYIVFYHSGMIIFFLYINGHKITKNIKNCEAENFHDTWAEWKMKKSFETVKVYNK